MNQNIVPLDMDMVIVARKAMISASWARLIDGFVEAVQRSRNIVGKRRGEK